MSPRLVLAAAVAAPALFLGLASPAMAQDESPFAGLYAGVTLGGAWGDFTGAATVAPGGGAGVIPSVDAAAINAAAKGSSTPSGFTGGVEGGYNLVGGGILLGLETDWEALDLKRGATGTAASASVAVPLTYSLVSHVHTDWTWTLRPRVGLTGGSWLVYGTGGLAITDVKSDLTYSDTRNPPRSATVTKPSELVTWPEMLPKSA